MDYMVFNAVFNSISVTYLCFPGVSFFFKPVLRKSFFPSHRLLSHKTNVETMDSGETRMNPVTITIINPRKEYWPGRGSNQQLPVLKYCTLPTELWDSPHNF